MALSNAYLITVKNLQAVLAAIQNARAPQQFTTRFLVQLGFKSTNDRYYIGLLKALSFLDETGTPTQRYYDFLDQTQAGRVLAEAIEEAYEDLFQINNHAENMSIEEVRNKLKTLTQGQKSDTVINLMATTFKALCEQADWSRPRRKPAPEQTSQEVRREKSEVAHDEVVTDKSGALPTFHFNIQVILPDTRDAAVFDAIFTSLKEHLL